MPLPLVSLRLAPPGSNRGYVLVRSTEGIRLCREGGHEEVPVHRACTCLDGLGRRELAGLRQFVAKVRWTRIAISSLADTELLALVKQAVKVRDLTVVRECDAAATANDGDAAKQRRLVREIERGTNRRLSCQGRSYRLVADLDLNRLRDRDDYEVVRQKDADQVLTTLAGQSAGDPALKAALDKARGKLSADWRPPLSPDGLILLRRIVATQASSPRTEDPITPSQLAKLLAHKDWIEIEVLYDDGRPYVGKYLLTHPDGQNSDGCLDKEGFWGAYEIDSGTYKFAVPMPEEEPGEEEAPKDEAVRVRLSGMLFDANKCFLLPQGLPGIKTIVATHQEEPAAEVLIVGHAGGDEDLAGVDIAFDRALILGAYLKSKPNVWLNWFGPDKSCRSRWGTREIQLMLSALPEGEAPFYQGYASGVTDAPTLAAIKAFQEQAGLPQDGKADFATRKALVEAYMGLEDTTLAEGVTPVAHGCEGHFDDTPTASGEEPDDRRLEVFFFKKAMEPRPDKTVSTAGSALYPQWLAKVVDTKDFEHHGIHVQIIDTEKQPAPFSTVHLTGPISADATSDEHGFVSFFGLKPGEYTISSEKDGYKIGLSKLCYPTAKTIAGHAKTAAPA